MSEVCGVTNATFTTVSVPLFTLALDPAPLVPGLVEQPVEVVLWVDSIPGWRLQQPLLVRIVRDSDGYFNAGDDTFDVYGDGLTREAALEDYKIALIEFYELVAEGAPDSPHDQVLLAHLQQYLQPR